jgi:hypothetical protein
MSRSRIGTCVCWALSLLLSLECASAAAEEGATLPYVQIESFPVPVSSTITPATLATLSAKTGIAGTEIVGIRLKIGLVDGHALEQLEVGVADGLFLVAQRGFFSSAGQLLIQIFRFLLLGQLVSAGSGLEIPAQSWSLLFGGQAASGGEMMNLHTRRELSVDGSDASITDHGEFVACRFLIAANRFSELVDVRIKTRHRRTQDWLSYRIPRMTLPLDLEVKEAVKAPRELVSLGNAEYVGNSSAFGGSEPLIFAAYLRSIEASWGQKQ